MGRIPAEECALPFADSSEKSVGQQDLARYSWFRHPRDASAEQSNVVAPWHLGVWFAAFDSALAHRVVPNSEWRKRMTLVVIAIAIASHPILEMGSYG